MTSKDLITIPARRGIAFELRKGQKLKIVNTYGSQVLDLWAFSLSDRDDYMSMEHTRSALSKLTPQVGDTLVSVDFRPMLTLVEDTSPGIHDTLMCCCSQTIYKRLGCVDYHDNCRDNFYAALKSVGWSYPITPGPFNLFTNFPVSPEGKITRMPPVSKPGDYVLFAAETDLLTVISACPQDITPINGLDRQTRDCGYQILN